MQPLIAGAPRITDQLCAACAEHFAGVRAHLRALGVAYRLEPRLVRGLDYYTRTTFEFYPARPGRAAGRARRRRPVRRARRAAGWQAHARHRLRPGPRPGRSSRSAAGRLGPRTLRTSPSVVVGADPPTRPRGCGRDASCAAAGLAARAELAQRKLGKQLESAAREGAHFAVICGDELATGQVLLRDLQAGTQRPVTLASWSARWRGARRSTVTGSEVGDRP